MATPSCAGGNACPARTSASRKFRLTQPATTQLGPEELAEQEADEEADEALLPA